MTMIRPNSPIKHRSVTEKLIFTAKAATAVMLSGNGTRGITMRGSHRARKTSMNGSTAVSPILAYPRCARGLRTAIRSLQEGTPPPQPSVVYEGVIPTFGGDTMLRIPPQPNRDDKAILKEVAHKVADIYQSADALADGERKEHIRNALKIYEASWQ